MSTPDAYSLALEQEHHPVCEKRTKGWYECTVDAPHVFRETHGWCKQHMAPCPPFKGCICAYLAEGEWEL